MAGKSQPEITDTAGKSRPSGARKGKARKSRQVTTSYDRKIWLPVTADTAGKIPASNYQIRPENLAASNYRNGRKIPGRNTMNAIAL
jgi:hypothetical protein